MHENYADRPHPEYVVLDIGDVLGALIVYTDAALHGTEIEISPDGADGDRSHKDVLERPQSGQTMVAYDMTGDTPQPPGAKQE